jgi:hypothetical protein
MGPAPDFHKACRVDRDVTLRGREAGVAETFLDRPQIGPDGEQRLAFGHQLAQILGPFRGFLEHRDFLGARIGGPGGQSTCRVVRITRVMIAQ